jgi:hypothetical protein
VHIQTVLTQQLSSMSSCDNKTSNYY